IIIILLSLFRFGKTYTRRKLNFELFVLEQSIRAFEQMNRKIIGKETEQVNFPRWEVRIVCGKKY
ncbi:MAG: hypothetical protein K8S16_03355, partial [Bacteroidales bacterium]|nr:hypothetical protein [Bacteroidales bacterium]